MLTAVLVVNVVFFAAGLLVLGSSAAKGERRAIVFARLLALLLFILNLLGLSIVLDTFRGSS